MMKLRAGRGRLQWACLLESGDIEQGGVGFSELQLCGKLVGIAAVLEIDMLLHDVAAERRRAPDSPDAIAAVGDGFKGGIAFDVIHGFRSG